MDENVARVDSNGYAVHNQYSVRLTGITPASGWMQRIACTANALVITCGVLLLYACLCKGCSLSSSKASQQSSGATLYACMPGNTTV